MNADMTNHVWAPIASVRTDLPVDVFYVNGSFETPSTGILFDATKKPRFWVSRVTGGQVPEMYVTLWREHQVDRASRDTEKLEVPKKSHLRIVKD